MTKQLTLAEEQALQKISQQTSKGALAVSEWSQVWSNNTHLGVNSEIMSTDLTGGASITDPTLNNPWVGLNVGTASGDKATFISRQFMRYWAYRTHRITFAVSFAPPIENTVQRVGIFDDDDGFLWEYSTEGLKVVHRTSTSGSLVETKVEQKDFNEDNLFGYQTSGLDAVEDFSFEKGLTYGIDYNWYGTQGAKFWVAYGFSVVYVHEFIFSGQVPGGAPYMRRAMLPFKCEIENVGVAPSGSTMRIGTSSHSVGDDVTIESYNQHSVSNGTTPISVDSTTVWQDVLAIRPKATINSIENRGLMALEAYQALVESNSIELRIIKNVTYTGGTWLSVSGTSIAEYSVSPGTQAGTPTVLEIDYIYSGRTDGSVFRGASGGANFRNSLDTLTGSQNAFVIQARKLSATTATVLATLTWREEF